VNIDDDGTVKVASADGESDQGRDQKDQVVASDPELGQIYDGTVVKVMEFGAFVNFSAPRTVSSTFSQLSATGAEDLRRRQEGDKVKVKLLGFDDRARRGCR